MFALAPAVTYRHVSLTLSEQTRNGLDSKWVILAVGGCLDHVTAPLLRERLIELLSSGRRCLVLDLEGVELLDSTGLGVLAGAVKRARQVRGSLQLVCTQHRVLRVFQVTGLTKVFSIHPSVDRATAAAGGPCAQGDGDDSERKGAAA